MKAQPTSDEILALLQEVQVSLMGKSVLPIIFARAGRPGGLKTQDVAEIRQKLQSRNETEIEI